jgi:tetratricopeptide (TPR) repeat protein
MRTITALFISLLVSPVIFAQQETGYTITPVDDGLYHLYYDSSSAKSTIVEFEKFIVLLEVPVKNEGGGATNLKDHIAGGNKVLATLKSYFPDKPLRYVLHTHWHPHSISSIKPFISNGITLISTRSNFEKLKEFADLATIQRQEKFIQFIENDSLVIKDRKNHLVAYRFLKKDFRSTPTSEYLYFFLPKYNALHSGCMFYRMPGQVEGREILTERVKDLHQFLQAKNLDPKCFIRSNGDKDEPRGMVPYDKFAHVVSRGITTAEISVRYFSVSESLLRSRRDSLLEGMVRNTIPVTLVNDAVYSCLRKNELQKALSFAQMQVMLNPADANAWDTLGQVYYFLGQKEMAAFYEKQTLRINQGFTAGGEKTWKNDLAEFRKAWK